MIPSGSKIDFNLLVSLLDNKTFGLMKLVKHSVKTSTCSAWILKSAGSACWKIFTYLLITYKAKKEIQSGFLLFDYRFLKNYLFFLFWRSCGSFFFSVHFDELSCAFWFHQMFHSYDESKLYSAWTYTTFYLNYSEMRNKIIKDIEHIYCA